MNEKESLGRRKEPRFKTNDDTSLQCDCNVEASDSIQGSIIDISASGLRFLCDEKFVVGQTFATELKTNRSHGSYSGVIRRVEPWTGGKFILGCQLSDEIPEDTLELLAHKGVINRRQEDRIPWTRPAKLSWELQPGEVDIEMQDCSSGGLQISSESPIPENVRLRIRVDVEDDEPIIVDAKTVWKTEDEDRCVAGVAFTKRDIPEAITQMLTDEDTGTTTSTNTQQSSVIRRGLLVASAMVVFGVSLWQIGIWG